MTSVHFPCIGLPYKINTVYKTKFTVIKVHSHLLQELYRLFVQVVRSLLDQEWAVDACGSLLQPSLVHLVEFKVSWFVQKHSIQAFWNTGWNCGFSIPYKPNCKVRLHCGPRGNLQEQEGRMRRGAYGHTAGAEPGFCVNVTAKCSLKAALQGPRNICYLFKVRQPANKEWTLQSFNFSRCSPNPTCFLGPSPVCCPCLVEDRGVTESIAQNQRLHSGWFMGVFSKFLSKEASQGSTKEVNLI